MSEARYVTLHCRGTDRGTGEPREWSHSINAERAEAARADILARWPDVTVDIKPANVSLDVAVREPRFRISPFV